MKYSIRSTRAPLELRAEWAGALWQDAETLQVERFRPESSDHRPATAARLLYDAHGIRGIFHVRDRYVRCLRTTYGGDVWKDSCVEFFAQPRPDRGYFNFEFNCGGAFLCSYITNPERTPTGFKESTAIPAEIGQAIRTKSSLPQKIDPEISAPVEWALEFYIPFALLEHYVGPLGKPAGQEWQGNFYKCAEEVSRPHWAAWSPVDEFNFHRPKCFGRLLFA